MELPGLAAAISAVHAIIAQAEAMGVRSERIVLGGFGQCGALALAAGRSHRSRLAGIASFSGWTAGPCIANEANVETPILLCHGTADHEVAYALMSESVQMLRKQHAATRIVEHTLDGLGHATNATESALLRAFLDEVLPCLEPTDTDAAPAALPATPALTKSVIKVGGRRPAPVPPAPAPPPTPTPPPAPAASLPALPPAPASIEQHPDVELSEIQSEIAGAWKIVVRNLDDAEKGMADLAEANTNGTLMGSMAHGHAAPAAVKNAVYDVVTRHFNGEMDPAAAAKELADAVAAAKG
jgi:hypothetical protein